MIKPPSLTFGSIKARPPLCTAGQRIGLLGGTFNPPHAGHRSIAQIALRRLQLDVIWWLVTPGNPLKDHENLHPQDMRMRQCRELADDSRMKITGFEQYLDTSYTASTLSFLTTIAPTTRFVWIMGADNLAIVHHWQSWREIFTTVPVAVVDRPGWHLRAMSSKAAKTFQSSLVPEQNAACLPFSRPPVWTMLSGPLCAQSSTRLRQIPGTGSNETQTET